MINLFFFKTFIAVAETGSFRLAAEKNNITQPAVSQHIQTLERHFSCVLFERSPKKIILTQDGQALIGYAVKLLQLYQDARSAVAANAKSLEGTIHIASIYTMGLYQLKPTLQKLLKEYPGINVNLVYMHHEDIYAAIKKGSVDFGLVAYPKKMPGCTAKIFDHEELLLVQSLQHRIFKKQTVSLSALNDVAFIGFDPATQTGKAIEQFLTEKKISPKIVKVSSNIETIKNAIDIGMGCSILPLSTIQQEIRAKHFEKIDVSGLIISRPLAVIYRNKKVFSPVTRLFYDLISKDTL